MVAVFKTVLRLYPQDIRFAYGDEMIGGFAAGVGAMRRRPLGRVTYALTQFTLLILDIAAERVSSLYSHRSFHGRRAPDLGVVRPPNMGKDEWFGWFEER
jgi:hypothetical protein